MRLDRETRARAVAPRLTNERPSVGVIIPCYNYGHFVEGCVASVLAQQGVEVRILIIDDCSPDGSAEVCRRLAAADDRIEFRAHNQNVGLIATANEGLDWVDEEYALLLSADDLLVPGCLHRATSVLSEHPSVGLVYGPLLIAREGRSQPERSGRWRGTDIWRGEDWIRRRCRAGHNSMASPEVVVRTSVQRAAGSYDPACPHASDLDMWLRIAAIADIAYIRGAAQAIYRVHAASMMRQNGPLTYLRERRAGFDAFFAKCPPSLNDLPELKAIVARTLARQALWKASRLVDARGDEGTVDEYVRFALEVYPEAPELREWRGLRLRRRIGSGRSALFLPFLATGAAHRVVVHAQQARLRLRGV